MAEEYIAQRLCDAFAHDRRVAELGLAVTIESGVVYISGEVTTEERRHAIATVAGELLPGHEIRNEVRVSAYRHPESMEHLP